MKSWKWYKFLSAGIKRFIRTRPFAFSSAYSPDDVNAFRGDTVRKGIFANPFSLKVLGSRAALRLFVLALMLGSTYQTQAASLYCSQPPFNGVVDGNNPDHVNALTTSPSIAIDTDCTFQDFPYPDNILNTQVVFDPNDGPFFATFDNVYFDDFNSGFSCGNNDHLIWFTNSSVSNVQNNCVDFFIPVEKIIKNNPSGQTTAAVGAPFTYSIKVAGMYAPLTGETSDFPSPNTLGNIQICDDLTAAATGVNGSPGAEMTYLSNMAYAVVDGNRTPIGPLTLSAPHPIHCPLADGTKHIFFSYADNPALQSVPAFTQIEIEMTVVLDDVPANAPNTEFANTAEWWFSRWIDIDDNGIQENYPADGIDADGDGIPEDEFFEPLKGENGLTPPMTIAAPELVVDKTGPDALGGLNLGEWGQFSIDVVNNGLSDAWSVTIEDQLPDGASGGMCDLTPQMGSITLAGNTLTENTDYTLDYAGAPTCKLTFTLLEAAGPIGPGEHLVIPYQTKLDPDSQNGALTNIAVATEWFNATEAFDNDDPNAGTERIAYTCPLPHDGTLGVDDCQDAHPVTVLLSGYWFEKSVSNVSTGVSPAYTAAPGDTLQYTLRLQTTDDPFNNVAFYDQLPADFEPGSLVIGPLPAGANNQSNPATGVIDIRNLNVAANNEISITFEITLRSTLTTGTVVTNQADLKQGATILAPSDDPNDVNGQADPAVSGDEYPTEVVIQEDNTALVKTVIADSYAETPASAANPVVRIGDTVDYQLALTLSEGTTYNLEITDILPAGLVFDSVVSVNGDTSAPYSSASPFTHADISAPLVSGDTVTWSLGNITNALDNNAANDTIVIVYRARVVKDVLAHQASTTLSNTATVAYTYPNGTPVTFDATRMESSTPLDVYQPVIGTITKTDVGAGRIGSGTSGDPYLINMAADTMQFQLEACNDALPAAPAYGMVLTDQLATQFNEQTLTDPVVSIDGNTLTETTDYTYTAPAARGGALSIGMIRPVNPGECVTVRYDVGFYTDVAANQTWSNSASVSEYWSLDDHTVAQQYSPVGPSEVWMTNLASAEQLLKSLVSPANGEATIGDEVVYQIKVPAVPLNAALDNVEVTDDLHGALEYLGATAVDSNGNAVALTDNVAANQVTLSIAHISAGQQAIITLRTRVANNDQANAGTSFANTASYTYTDMPPDTVTASTSGPLTIIEPSVTVTKTASTTVPQAGDLITYTLELTAQGAGEGDEFADAFDLTIEDSLGLGLAYEPGSATLDGAALADPVTNGEDGVSGAQTLTWSLANGHDIDITEGAAATVTYQVRVLDSVAPGQTVTNSVIGRWSSLEDDQSAIERTGSGTPALNDYFTQPVEVTLTTPLSVSVVKSVINATTGEDPGANAEPGETLRYTLVLTNDSIVPVDNVSVVDELAAQFVPGSLQLVTVPAGADTTATDPAGGANNTGIVDIRNLNLAATGDASGNDTLTIVFEAALASVIDSGTTVLNQAQLTGANLTPATSNQTSTLISSAPVFRISKTSDDITDDPAVLLPGDTLHYTITVQNTGNEDAFDVTLSDPIPNGTTYVPDSTFLNGVAVADPSSGISALQAGMLIYAPGDSTPGVMRADATASAANTATITFDVVLNADVVEGTFISNQGYVNGNGGGSGPFSRPSDDPDTATVDDPTRDFVGDLPLIDVIKKVDIQTGKDLGTPGVVDPGDVLIYTITVNNLGTVAATGVTLTDAIPANTTYVSNTTQLNGATVADPSANVSALESGMPVNASGSAGGTIDAGASAVVTFEVLVDGAVAAGTTISNQGYVASSELATEPSDEDGDDSNGDQPTTIVVGTAQQLSIVKRAVDINGGFIEAGDTLEYTVRASNTGSNPATNVVLTDDLNPIAGQVSYVTGSAVLERSAGGVVLERSASAVSDAGGVLSADYAAVFGNLQPGEEATLRFKATIDDTLPIGTQFTNTGQVEWSSPTVSATDSYPVIVGGIPENAVLSGQVWHDADFDNLPGGNELNLEDWQVTALLNGAQVGVTTTDANGLYQLIGPPTAGTDQYELRFSAPGATSTTAKLGQTDSTHSATPFTDGLQVISAITAPSGSSLQNLNLPIDPNGVVFNSIMRTPVQGATLTLLRNGTAVDSSCLDDPAQQGQVTLASGYYKFDLNFSDPSCPSGSDYVIQVTPPVDGYFDRPSVLIQSASNDPAYDNDPAYSGGPATPYSVAICSGDAVSTPAGYCEAMPSEFAPDLSVVESSVVYHLYLTLNTPVPGDSQLFNNHIPIDPYLDNALTITKTSALVNATRSQLVPYTITVNNTLPVILRDLNIVDTFPPGFKYVSGSARVNGSAQEPVMSNGTLSWNNLQLAPNEQATVKLLLIVGSGVSEGEYINRAQAFHTALDGAASGVAAATVHVVPDPTFDCTDVTGKVFDDKNLNGYQDEGETGLPGVRMVSARGLIVTTDKYGRFHITCAVVPNESRGSNYILKLDDRSLPSGYRVTSENPRVQRATRGKMMKFNFGATVHHVVRMDVADGAFEPDSAEMREQWRPRIELLLKELKKAPSVLRLSYLADVEKEGLVRERLAKVKAMISEAWEELNCCYKLTIESEVYWRRGAPPDRSGAID